MNSFFRLFLVRWLIALMVLPGICEAQALPSRMQVAISNLIQQKAIQRGFAANDPRISVTLQSAGTSVAGAAAAAAVVTAAGVTAPAWLTVAATTLLGGLLAYGLDLAVDKIKMYFNSGNGTFSFQDKPSSSLKSGQTGYTDGYGNWGGSIHDVGLGVVSAPNLDCQLGCGVRFDHTDPSSGRSYYMGTRTYMTDTGAVTGDYFGVFTLSPGTYTGPDCAGVVVNGSCAASTPNTATSGTAQDAVNSLSDDDKSQPVNPALVASLAQKAWESAASQPGYAGLPVDPSNPITTADAQAAQSSSPSTWPTVGDAVAPQAGGSSSSGTSGPWAFPVGSAAPSTGTGTGTTTNPGTGTNTGTDTTPQTDKPIDWGTFSPPALEETPSIGSILDPLFNMWPAWASFSFPQHQSVCPTPSFTLPGGVLNGSTVHFTQMCDFLEANNVRVAMQAAFAVAWAILIVFIVMGA